MLAKYLKIEKVTQGVKLWFVYVLLCEGGSYYTGSTNDVEKRFLVHKSGKGSKYTRSHKPVKIVHTETFNTKSDALKREAEIKKWDKTKKVRQLKLGEA